MIPILKTIPFAGPVSLHIEYKPSAGDVAHDVAFLRSKLTQP